MNKEEKVVKKYLEQLKIGKIIHEPDNGFPDFSVNEKIGVEVRRLNQNYQKNENKSEGLEEKSIRLFDKIKSEITKIPSLNDECWYVKVQFKRPISISNKVWNKISTELLKFREDQNRDEKSIQISDNLSLKITLSGVNHGSFFRFGGLKDKDWSGFYISELIQNLKLVILEKEKDWDKKPNVSKYEQWWLILVDYITGSIEFDDIDLVELKKLNGFSEYYDKVIIIDPNLSKDPFTLMKIKS